MVRCAAALTVGVLAVVGLAACAAEAEAEAGDPIRVMLIDGQNNHDFAITSPWMQRQLETTGRFEVAISRTPGSDDPQEAWDDWQPDFDAYDAVLLNYNGEIWPERVRDDFEQFVHEGGGVVAIHAANNPFAEWDAYNQMIGLGWRGADFGYRVYFDDEGEKHRLPPGEGRGAGHGAHYAFTMETLDTDHPVTAGYPQRWHRPVDELYHGQRGPAEDMHILATAWDDPDQNGSDRHEPLIWWIPYGEGKVFTNVTGHVWQGEEDPLSMRCVGFITTLQRSTEWVATGEVTIPIPDNFPTADEASTIPYDE